MFFYFLYTEFEDWKMTEKIQRWKTAFPGSSSPKISMISSPPRNREIGPFVRTGIVPNTI